MSKHLYIKNAENSNELYTLLGVVAPIQKCAVKVVATNEHCPELGINKIEDSEDYLCDRCYKNWLANKAITPNGYGYAHVILTIK